MSFEPSPSKSPSSQPRRILLYGRSFAPEQTGVGKDTRKTVEWLVWAGYEYA